MNQAQITPRPHDGADDGFVFRGETIAIDLVNTEVVVRGKPIDLLATPDAYRAWWRAARQHDPRLTDDLADGEANPDLLPRVKRLRAALRRLFETVADGRPAPVDDLGVLNDALAAVHGAVAIEPGGDLRPRWMASPVDGDGPLTAVARSAFTLLTQADRSRLHRCANGRCVLLFYDTTKSATRRWCSTACMNRARSSQRYRDRKTAQVADAAPSPADE